MEQYTPLDFKPNTKHHCDVIVTKPTFFIKLDSGKHALVVLGTHNTHTHTCTHTHTHTRTHTHTHTPTHTYAHTCTHIPHMHLQTHIHAHAHTHTHTHTTRQEGGRNASPSPCLLPMSPAHNTCGWGGILILTTRAHERWLSGSLCICYSSTLWNDGPVCCKYLAYDTTCSAC